jgi:hypothetical protein
MQFSTGSRESCHLRVVQSRTFMPVWSGMLVGPGTISGLLVVLDGYLTLAV